MRQRSTLTTSFLPSFLLLASCSPSGGAGSQPAASLQKQRQNRNTSPDALSYIASTVSIGCGCR